MDKLLEKTKQAVAKYKLRSDKDKLNATKALWLALRSFKKAIKTLESEQEGITVQMAKELGDIIVDVPVFHEVGEPPQEENSQVDDKQSADQFIDRLEAQLRGVVNQLESDKSSEIDSWLGSQPVLAELIASLSEKVHDSTYVLLFRGRDRLQLMTSQAPDGRIFTRFRPREFQNKRRVYRIYHRRPPVGAVIVSEGKITKVIGRVPQPAPGEDQLQLVASMSKEAASLPAKRFVGNNRVLQALHEMCKGRKLDKSTYVLLFLGTPLPDDRLPDDTRIIDLADDNVMDIVPSDLSGEEMADFVEDNETDLEELEESAENGALNDSGEQAESSNAPQGDDGHESASTEAQPLADTEHESTSTEAQPLADAEHDSASTEAQPLADAEHESASTEAQPLADAEHESASTEAQPLADAEHESASTELSESAPDSAAASEAALHSAADLKATSPQEEGGSDVDSNLEKPEIFTKVSSEGAVITRFYSNEFSDIRKLFDTFAKQRTVCGAAIIKGNELIEVLGRVPEPQGGETPLKVLIRESNHAADKPTRDFLEENEILSDLHKLAAGEFHDANAKVVLFSEDENGRLAPVKLPQKERDTRKQKDHGRQSRGRDREHGRERDSGRGGDWADNRTSAYLSDFRFARDIRTSFKGLPRIVGASVIGELRAPKAPVRSSGDDRNRRDNRGKGDRDRDQHRKGENRQKAQTVVLVAYGRTPLKQNILITDDTIRRLGLDMFI